MRIDAIVKVHFYKPGNGGLPKTFSARTFRCPFQFGDALHEGGLLTNSMPIEPGQTYTLPLVFLQPDLVRPKLTVGMKIFLKNGFVKNLGEAEILEICPENVTVN